MPFQLDTVRAAIPGLADETYLNTGGAGPVPEVVDEAIRAALDVDLHRGRMGLRGVETMEERRAELRHEVAVLLGGTPGEIALTGGVTSGLNTAIWGIDWRRGDEVITTNAEHVALTLPLEVIHRRFGVRIRVVDVSEGVEDLEGAITAFTGPRTRLVALSHVTWTDGACLDVAAAARAARAVGALTLVDGAQAVGVLSVNPGSLGVDAYAFPAQKWLLGPQGLGALWVGTDALPRIEMSFSGGGAVDWTELGARGRLPDARRFEMGHLPEPLLPGWRAALRWLAELRAEDSDVLSVRTEEMVRFARAALEGIGATVRTPHARDRPSGLIAFTLPGLDPRATAEELERRGVITRWVAEPAAIRISVAFFTADEDIVRLCDELDRMRTAGRPG